MRFDDRLLTVLGQQPQFAHDRAVRWRQLVELLARGGNVQTPLVQQAYAEVRSEAPAIDEQIRAAAARAVAGPRLPAELIALFAADTITVAAPVLAAVTLSPEEWGRVLDRASPNSRRFLRALLGGSSDRSAQVEELATEIGRPMSAGAEPAHVPSISEVVARIERLRAQREGVGEPFVPPAEEAGTPPALFRWECDPSGEIGWVEGAPRGSLIGRSLIGPAGSGIDAQIRRAFSVRAPFRDASLAIAGEGAVAGEWMLSGVPAFEPVGGRFAGYRGIAVRATPVEAPRAPRATAFDEDSIRELVHELKTPLNAIVGFAEIIDGEYLGPADEKYRERAAEIVAEARLLLSAIEDLDLAAQLRSSPDRADGATDLRELVAQASADLVERASRRGASLAIELPAQPVRGALGPSLAERIVRRFFGSMLDQAGEGERVGLSLRSEDGRCLLAIDKPARPGRSLSSNVSLRLVKALARVVRGDLRQESDRTVLELPEAS